MKHARFYVILLPLILALGGVIAFAAAAQSPKRAASDYIVLAWNDLGMHCYNRDFQDLAVLPPYNTLWAQVMRLGNPPQIVTSGVTVSYLFADNTTSAGKSNFWQYAQALFGVALAPDIGLTGRGLSGEMTLDGDHFVVEGIPLTEYSDSAPSARQPYQLATVIVRDASSGAELARAEVVAPVSTEMRCDNCHYDGGVEDISTGRVETNILTLHDREELGEDGPELAYSVPLMSQRPVLCANCHASNALGKPGVSGLPSLSRAMHNKHSGEVPSTLDGCYSCHPGPQTRCLRDVMSQKGITCVDCHGNLSQVASNPAPWLQEPRCDSASCHGSAYPQDQALYRQSKGHSGVYCAGCHDSPHAIAPSTQANDALKFVALQGHAGTLSECAVCHSVAPTAAGPHGLRATPTRPRLYLPLIRK